MRPDASQLICLTVVGLGLALCAPACRGSARTGAGANGGAPGGTTTGAAAATTPGYSQVAPIIKNACAKSCHNGRDQAIDDFVFTDETNLLQRLLDAPPATVPVPCQNRPLVVSGHADRSLLIAVVEQPEGPRAECAERMPQGCPDRRPCLSAAEIGTIRAWIDAGARR